MTSSSPIPAAEPGSTDPGSGVPINGPGAATESAAGHGGPR